MDRTDFIENRIDVIKNIYTLYSYAKSSIVDNKEWALQRFKQGNGISLKYLVTPYFLLQVVLLVTKTIR